LTTTRSIATRADLSSALEELIGMECWSVVGGRGAGSVILVGLGERVRRDREIANPLLTEEERQFDPLFSFMIWCSWRVEMLGKVVGSWLALTETGELEPTGALGLKGRRLTGFHLDDPIPDLHLDFGDLRLSLFVDTLSKDSGDEAYAVKVRSRTYGVFANGTMDVEESAEA
jgi:hypothetical protein